MSQPQEGAGPRRYADELRHDIDSGRTGDKIPYPDPAAAPLGTDDEAAGYPPSSGSVQHAMAAEEASRGINAAPQRSEWVLAEGGPAYGVVVVVALALVLMMFFSISSFR